MAKVAQMVKMIYSLWVVERYGSRNVFNKSYQEEDIDPDLLSSFLTALHQIAQTLSGKKGIENIDMGGSRWVYDVHDELIFIIAASKNEDARILKKQIHIIRDLFSGEFKEITKKDYFKNWSGRRDKFLDFTSILDNLMDQWYSAEKVTSSARMLDLLEVYQQIFDTFKERSTEKVGKEFVFEKLQSVTDEFPDFFKEIYTKDKINLLSIDVVKQNIGEIELRLGLRQLFEAYLDAWKNVLSAPDLDGVHEKIRKYIKKDWDRIEKLKLSKIFLTKFL